MSRLIDHIGTSVLQPSRHEGFSDLVGVAQLLSRLRVNPDNVITTHFFPTVRLTFPFLFVKRVPCLRVLRLRDVSNRIPLSLIETCEIICLQVA